MVSAKDGKGTCCGLAAKLGTEKLAALDEELSRPNHRSFRKLVVEFGVSRSSIERHKNGCLHLGEPSPREVKTFAAPETSDLPPVRRRAPRRKGVSQVSHGTGAGTAGVPDGTAPAAPSEPEAAARARAPESENPAERRRNRVLEIVSAMSDGTWDTPRDNAVLRATQWGVSKSTVEEMVREASVGAAVDPESVRQRRVVSMGRWGWGVDRARTAIEDGPVFPDTMSKLLASYAHMQTGWDKAAGVLDESPKTINIVGHPVFTGMLESVLLAVQPFPEARAAVMAAVRAKLDVLRQPAPTQLAAGSIETTGEMTGTSEEKGAAA